MMCVVATVLTTDTKCALAIAETFFSDLLMINLRILFLQEFCM